jgi:hypothetical protein
VKRGRLTKYAIYQLGDYMRERGVFVGLIGIIIGWGALLGIRGQYGIGWKTMDGASLLSEGVIRSALTQLSFFTVLLSVAGVVANDRKHGYFRLFFAKPVNVVRFYLQAFAAAWVGALLVMLILHGIWSLVAPAVAPWGTLRAMTFQFWVAGSTAFLMSTLVKWDWVATGVLWGGSEIFREIYRNDSGAIAWLVRHFTAPTHVIGELRDAAYNGTWPDNEKLTWALLYGAACMVLAVIVLRRRPLAT